jgi:hypothetical protein
VIADISMSLDGYVTARGAQRKQLCGISRSDFLTAVTSIRDARTTAEAAKSAYVTYAPGMPMEDSGTT